MSQQPAKSCPAFDTLGSGVQRRDFLRMTGALAMSALLPYSLRADADSAALDSYVGELYKSLSADQKKVLCFPYDHPLRTKAQANWNITEPSIDSLETVQQDLVEKIVRGLSSEEGFEKFMTQMGDDHGGMGSYHIALFGDPAMKDGKCQFVLTGRHATMRADAYNNDGVAFSGPMVYGHASMGFNEKADHPGNVFWYQAKRANEVFAALDSNQRAKAMGKQAPEESSIELRTSGYDGLPVAEMTPDQKNLVKAVMADLLNPYSKAQVDEVMHIIADNGGMDKINLAFYKQDSAGKNIDIGDDSVWDVWRLEGPGFVWHFRGAPHVHTWVNIAKVNPSENS
ncbi:MAG: DUF3500 domain-containing protein [Planctomycetota bacterium]